jgi:hypothetical protein
VPFYTWNNRGGKGIPLGARSAYFLININLNFPRKDFLTHTSRGLQFTKRCCLSWLTNSAHVYEPKCGGRGEAAGSQPMSTAVHGAQIDLGGLTSDLTYAHKQTDFFRSCCPWSHKRYVMLTLVVIADVTEVIQAVGRYLVRGGLLSYGRCTVPQIFPEIKLPGLLPNFYRVRTIN